MNCCVTPAGDQSSSMKIMPSRRIPTPGAIAASINASRRRCAAGIAGKRIACVRLASRRSHPRPRTRITPAGLRARGGDFGKDGASRREDTSAPRRRGASGNTIANNRGFGLLLNQTSSAQVAGAGIQYNASDGILLQWGSKLFFTELPSTTGGNAGFGLRCPDAESSVVGLEKLTASPPNALGDVSPTCTGF